MKSSTVQFITALFIFGCSAVMAQNVPGFRQYRFNALVLNPAQAGSNDFSDVSVMGTQYWVGMPGAPQTGTISGNFKVFDNFGVGAAVIADQTGPVNSTNVDLMGAYHLKLGQKWKLSAGLKLSAINHSVVTSELATYTSNDPDMMENLSTGLSYNAGFGFLAYSKNFFIGASLPRVASLRFDRMDMSTFVDDKGGYLAYGGGVFKINEQFELRPSLLGLFGYGGPAVIDLNVVSTIKNLIDVGLTYQWKGNVGAILGINIQDKLFVGYSYSYPVNNMNRVSIQSHEIALRLKFNKKINSADSPRFFN
jgi:type IX secretion system PorP/SprF family membrane protein